MTVVRRIGVGVTDATSAEGGNSAYLLPERGVVVDPGPPSERAWRQLSAGIDDASIALDDVQEVLVTHWHADHAGLAPRLADAADATLRMHPRDAPLVGEYAAARRRRIERDRERLVEWGVPPSLASTVTAGDDASPLPDAWPVERVADGDRVAGLTARHTPGHTLGHVAFVLDDRAFVGDAVLRTCTPNVGGGDTRLVDGLRRYERTLRTLESAAETAYPGHGEPFQLRERVQEIRDHHAARTERVRALLRAGGAQTPWELAQELFGRMDGVHVKFGAGEAATHLVQLAARGEAVRTGDDPATFEPA